MTVRTAGDAAAATGGFAASAWNFVIGGQLNILIGVVVGVLSIAVLIQRFMINRKISQSEDK
tara:strand:+ start:382 stop:567 length:186 start_codon:yes stop_codon:yes gene_type:complete